MIICNIAAGWSPGSLTLKTAEGGTTDAATKFQEDTTNGGRNERALGELGIPPAETLYGNMSWPQSINISRSWAQYLNPVIDELNLTVSDVLFRELLSRDRWIECSIIMSALVANGLGRTSWNSALQGDVKTNGSNGEGSIDGNY